MTVMLCLDPCHHMVMVCYPPPLPPLTSPLIVVVYLIFVSIVIKIRNKKKHTKKHIGGSRHITSWAPHPAAATAAIAASCQKMAVAILGIVGRVDPQMLLVQLFWCAKVALDIEVMVAVALGILGPLFLWSLDMSRWHGWWASRWYIIW